MVFIEHLHREGPTMHSASKKRIGDIEQSSRGLLLCNRQVAGHRGFTNEAAKNGCQGTTLGCDFI